MSSSVSLNLLGPLIARLFAFVAIIFTKVLFLMPPCESAEQSQTSRSYLGILRRLIATSHGPQHLQNKDSSRVRGE